MKKHTACEGSSLLFNERLVMAFVACHSRLPVRFLPRGLRETVLLHPHVACARALRRVIQIGKDVREGAMEYSQPVITMQRNT